MLPVYKNSTNMNAAARVIFSKPIIDSCCNMVEEQKSILFTILQSKFQSKTLRNGRNAAWVVPSSLLPTNYMTWPSLFSIKEGSAPQFPTIIRPADAHFFIQNTYSSEHREFCLRLGINVDEKFKQFYELCNTFNCSKCLRCRQWNHVYIIWNTYRQRNYKTQLRYFFASLYIPTFFLLTSQEVS